MIKGWVSSCAPLKSARRELSILRELSRPPEELEEELFQSAVSRCQLVYTVACNDIDIGQQGFDSRSL